MSTYMTTLKYSMILIECGQLFAQLTMDVVALIVQVALQSAFLIIIMAMMILE